MGYVLSATGTFSAMSIVECYLAAFRFLRYYFLFAAPF
jgi:hypothetical protein